MQPPAAPGTDPLPAVASLVTRAISHPRNRRGEHNTKPYPAHPWEYVQLPGVTGHLHPNLFINKVTAYSKLLQAFTHLSIAISSLTDTSDFCSRCQCLGADLK